jgi:hypothetical protein
MPITAHSIPQLKSSPTRCARLPRACNLAQTPIRSLPREGTPT